MRKLDWNLMSLFFVLCEFVFLLQNLQSVVIFPANFDCEDMLAFLDRGNIGNARIAGMAKDLNLDNNRYDWLLTIFYISYIFAFSVLLWKVFPPHLVGAAVVFGW